jgi:serine/threonine protein kinase
MSPEQLAGERLTERPDMYSLGAVFYRLLTGHQPVNAEPNETSQSYARRIMDRNPAPIAGYRPEVPPGLVAVVEKMLAKQPDARYESWLAFLYTLQRSAALGFQGAAETHDRRWQALELQRRARSAPQDRSLSFGW